MPAAACAVLGLFGLADWDHLEPIRQVVYVLPHVLGVGMTALGGYHHPWAGVVGVCTSALMAGLSWSDRLTRETEGFEWEFNNAFGSMICCWVNYVLFFVATGVISILGAWAEHSKNDVGESDKEIRE